MGEKEKRLGLIAIVVSMAALFVALSQAVIAYKIMDRSLEANVLTSRLQECGKIISGSQLFSNIDSEYRVLQARKNGKIPQNLIVKAIVEMPSDEIIRDFANKRATKGYEYLVLNSTGSYLFGKDMREFLAQKWRIAMSLLDANESEIELRSSQFSASIHDLMRRCSSLSDRFDPK